MKPYNALDWYWTVADNATEVYSSKAGNYVGVDDADFVAWSEEDTETQSTKIGTEYELGGVLYPHRLLPIPQGVLDGYLDAQMDHLATEPDYEMWLDVYRVPGATEAQTKARIRAKLAGV